MKKINVSKKDLATAAGFAVVGAAAGLAVSKLTTKADEVEGDTACCNELDADAAGIEDDSPEERFVPTPIVTDGEATEV